MSIPVKTVFFGPFIGELSWELLFWQGWVRKVCLGEFWDFRKIGASFPGREPFYPYVNEFWPLPASFIDLGTSGYGYFTDGWRGGLPGRQIQRPELWKGRLGISLIIWGRNAVPWIRQLLPRPIRRALVSRGREACLSIPDVTPAAETLLAQYRELLPEGTLFFVPWKQNYYAADELEFGVTISDGSLYEGTYQVKAIDYRYQRLEELVPTPQGVEALRRLVPRNQRLIAVFPRRRLVRRSDKNWPKMRYQELIRRIQKAYPELTVALVGAPDGAYFGDGVPPGCLDLINGPADRRLDIQIAALQQSVIALGSMSGALAVAMAAGCHTLIWGYPEFLEVYQRANFLSTPLSYHPEMTPSVEAVFGLMRSHLLSGESRDQPRERVDPQPLSDRAEYGVSRGGS
jgi:hypothetical protein